MKGGGKVSYQALYRVWRPQNFIDVVGQEHVTKHYKTPCFKIKSLMPIYFLGQEVQGKQVRQKS